MIDILLASYNGEKYIREQMESIINQTSKQWQLIVHDDCSSDKTVQIARTIAKEFNHRSQTENLLADDHRRIDISVNDKACGSAAGNFMQLLKSSDSEYTMFSDQDDVWHEDKVHKTFKLMKNAERKYGKQTPLLIYTDLVVVDSNRNKIADSFIQYMKVPPKITLPRLLLQNSVTGCTMMMNKALRTLLSEVDEVGKLVMHDHFVALVAAVFGKVLFLPEATIDYRQHGGNSVGASDARSLSYLWMRFRRGGRAFREDMKRSMIQAEYFYNVYQDRMTDNKGVRDLISGYACLQEKWKGQRIWFYIKHRVIKYGCFRAIMQMIWG